MSKSSKDINIRKKIEKMFDADIYNRDSLIRFSAGEDLLTILNIKNQEKVLDIGCGTGKVTSEIFKTTPKAKIIAIDISQDMIKKARQEFGDTSIQFICHM